MPRSKNIVVVLTAFALASCSSSNGETESGDSPRLPGPSDALVAEAVTNTYVEDPVIDGETELDPSGREIERTRIEIVFRDDATVGAANALLTELDATITASLAGLPSLVVRIPDPGTLDALNRLIADVRSRDSVSAVLRSILKTPTRLPDNVESVIFKEDTQDASDAREWRYVAHHLAVRAHAAWNADAAAEERPMMVVQDTFGQGQLPDGILDAAPLLGEEFDIASAPLECNCINPPNDSCKQRCRERQHGYFVVGIAAGEHRSRTGNPPATPLQDLVTGIAPNGVGLSVVDGYRQSDRQATIKLFQVLEEVARKNTGMIVLNLSIGFVCDDDTIPGGVCVSNDFLRDYTRHWINAMRITGLENRVLVVSAAGNREFDEQERKHFGSYDAKTSSEYNAASLIPTWPDGVGGNPLSALSNTLVVENARRTESPPDGEPPFFAECTSASSFLGGHIAGIGGSVFSLIGGSDYPGANTNVDQTDDGGTSSAAPQVAGLAAYMSAIDSDLTPQRAISLIQAVATRVPGTSPNSDCWAMANAPRADVIDAYASVLALDPPGSFSDASATVRLALLDVAGPDGAPDAKFTEQDLELLLALTDPSDNEGAGTLDYGRYDLNGDGRTGGIGNARFDLDISDVTQPGAFGTTDNRDLAEALGIQGTFDENAVTDRQVLCYYAYTDLYDGDEERRDEVLKQVAADCAPCAGSAAEAEAQANGFATKQLPDFCEAPQDFIIIADLADFPDADELLPPAINDEGLVAFSVKTPNASVPLDPFLLLLVGDGSEAAAEDYAKLAESGDDLGGLTDIDPMVGRFDGPVGAGSLFGFGIVDRGTSHRRVMVASDPDGDGFFDLQTSTARFVSSLDINSFGDSVIATNSHETCPNDSSKAIVVTRGGQERVVACSNTDIFSNTFNSLVGINDSGEAMFNGRHATDRDGVPVFENGDPLRNARAVWRAAATSDVTATTSYETLAVERTVFGEEVFTSLDFNFAAPINNSGVTVLSIRRDVRGSSQTLNFQELFTADENALTRIASEDTGPFKKFGSASINDAGTVAFLACTTDNCFGSDIPVGESGGLYTGSDPVSDEVLGIGDPLFGSTVTALAFQRSGLNNAGEMAFLATLADGRQLVVKRTRAEP